MDNIQEFVNELNALLRIRQLKIKSTIKPILFEMKGKFSCKFIFLETDYYNEESTETLKKLKIIYLKDQKYGLARKFRELERECNYYSEIINRNNENSSKFHYEDNALMFFCADNTYVEISIAMYFKELS